jgi:urate oxidase
VLQHTDLAEQRVLKHALQRPWEHEMSSLSRNAYGKSHVRLTRVTRHGAHHELTELSVDIELQGDFVRCYTHGDNSSIIATDTMKNTVYALAKKHPLTAIENFAQALASHFVESFSHVTSATVDIQVEPWNRIEAHGHPHPHAFISGGSEHRTARVTRTRERTRTEAGIVGMVVLKTTKSGFVGYIRDQYTTLKETTDRIFATSVKANWLYNQQEVEWNESFQSVRQALIETFAEHDSLSVQQTLYAMGEAALAACPSMEEMTLTLPNQHRILINLEPFGMENRNEMFVSTTEPFGLISGTIRRD